MTYRCVVFHLDTKVALGVSAHETERADLADDEVGALLAAGHTAVIGKTSAEGGALNYDEVPRDGVLCKEWALKDCAVTR